MSVNYGSASGKPSMDWVKTLRMESPVGPFHKALLQTTIISEPRPVELGSVLLFSLHETSIIVVKKNKSIS